jgi:hypothetical protein
MTQLNEAKKRADDVSSDNNKREEKLGSETPLPPKDPPNPVKDEPNSNREKSGTD